MHNANNNHGWREHRWRIAMWGAAALLLIVPLLAMQVTHEVNWGLGDFVLAGVLLFGAGLLYELAAKAGNLAYRGGVALALAAAVGLIWVSLAVGIIGSEDEPANLLYGGVLAVGIAGAVLARFQPQGMARALFATAVAQALVGIAAVVMGLGARSTHWPWDILALTAGFCALFGGSALLFRRAALARPPAPANNAQ
jgi:MFS family permease